MILDSRFVTAMHVLTLLASASEPLPSPRLAASIGVNPVTVRKVVASLRDHGMVETLLGSAGGARLARPAPEISLRDAYLSVREGTIFGAFPDHPNPHCLVGRNIQAILVDLLDETERAMIAPLAEISVADLLAQVRERDEHARGR